MEKKTHSHLTFDELAECGPKGEGLNRKPKKHFDLCPECRDIVAAEIGRFKAEADMLRKQNLLSLTKEDELRIREISERIFGRKL